MTEKNNNIEIPISYLETSLIKEFPEYATIGSSGMDLKANLEFNYILKPSEWYAVPTGLAIALPHGFEGQVRPRSGLAMHHGISILNSPGTIDEDYRGEIKVILINLSKEEFLITPEMRIAQLIIARYEKIRWKFTKILPNTDRDKGGFGHTGF